MSEECSYGGPLLTGCPRLRIQHSSIYSSLPHHPPVHFTHCMSYIPFYVNCSQEVPDNCIWINRGFHISLLLTDVYKGTLGYWPDDGVLSPAGAGISSLRHCIHTSPGIHPHSYAMGSGGAFSGGKAAGAWSWPLTSISAEVKNAWSYTSSLQTHIHSVMINSAINISSWRGTLLRKGSSLPLPSSVYQKFYKIGSEYTKRVYVC